MDNLPTLNVSVMHILKLLNNDTTTQPKLMNAINRDPSICAQMLRMVNSGLYCMRQRIENVDQAAALLGRKQIRNIALSASVMDIISGKEKILWLHSYSTALLLKDLIKHNGLKISPDIEVAALVHDIGQIVLMEFSKTSYQIVNKRTEDDAMPVQEAEDTILHITHDKVSSWLLEMWEISDSIRIPVANHHQDIVPEEYVMESVMLQLADYIDLRARKLPCTKPSKKLMDAIELDLSEMEAIVSYQEGLITEVDQSGHIGTVEKDKPKDLTKLSLWDRAKGTGG